MDRFIAIPLPSAYIPPEGAHGAFVRLIHEINSRLHPLIELEEFMADIDTLKTDIELLTVAVNEAIVVIKAIVPPVPAADLAPEIASITALTASLTAVLPPPIIPPVV